MEQRKQRKRYALRKMRKLEADAVKLILLRSKLYDTTLLMFVIGIVFGRLNELAVAFGILFLLVTSCHTIGSTLNSTSMESVPFETGIKAIVGCWLEARTKKQKCKAD